ncbi:unnamed protein product [Darwinula stevensoni]|uniref:Uncharacterized protein n=1 Tax=Darwinula stevensoni TaxID=69355 RepID=A0A7R9AIZ1_9CRUS|nr:unnamed protein product [Darwinula stevensoni]CAG0907263.1 unnamed protein product [Darwinula stevensoni]
MQHLAAIKQLIERYQPESFSEHLAWSSHGLNYYNDLLPIAYTEAALERVVSHIEQVQDYLGRRILIENPSTYVQFSHSSMSEPEFIGQVLQRSGCGLLLDINNIYVSSRNHGWDANHYLNALGSQALASVGELHLAGFAQDLDANQEPLLIDNHGAPVDPAVWALYRQALPQVLRHGGNIATLLERDNHIPPLPVLLQECQKAQDIINESLATSTSSTA